MTTSKKYVFFVGAAILEPLETVLKNLKSFVTAALGCAVLSALISYATGQVFSCQFFYRQGTVCPQMEWGNIAYFASKVFLFAVFASLWIALVFKDQKADRNLWLKNGWAYVRNFLILLLVFALCALPFISTVVLIRREPNPNWIIELLYFTVVGAGLLVPLILMRLSGVIYDLMSGNGLKNLGKIWTGTAEKGLKIVLSCAFIFLFCTFLLFGVVKIFPAQLVVSNVLVGFVGELLFDMMCLFVIAVVISFCRTMKRLAVESADSESVNNTSNLQA
jgi:hypothetical protein